MISPVTITAAILLIITLLLGLSLSKAKQQVRDIQEDFKLERDKIRKDAKFRSSAVNWGKTIEHFVPFMDKFPIPPEDVVFLGMPIDYVGFSNTGSKTKCEVHFVEVKSGNSFLMGKQKNIKRAIKEGRVYWHEIGVESNRAKKGTE
jgi:predicted Holliday junction resolvase-like endonuclease